MSFAEGDRFPREAEDLVVSLEEAPIVPGKLIVLTVGVVVAVLRAPELVAPEQHGNAAGQEERGEHVFYFAPSRFLNHWVVGGSLYAIIRAEILIRAVAILLAVCFIVLLGIAY